MNDVGRFHVRLDRLRNMRAAHVHTLSERPEEDAWRIIDSWAESRNVFKRSETRVFGRNTYPTDKPEPHGYEFYVTVGSEVTGEGEVDISEIPGARMQFFGSRVLRTFRTRGNTYGTGSRNTAMSM